MNMLGTAHRLDLSKCQANFSQFRSRLASQDPTEPNIEILPFEQVKLFHIDSIAVAIDR
jgi:hypothetical protein